MSTRHFPNRTESLLRYDLIGDIAVIQETHTGSGEPCEIFQVLKSRHPGVRILVKKISSVKGSARTAVFTPLYGSGTLSTIHREFGFSYHIDLEKVFFNPRLANERARLAFRITPDEKVFIPFAGVGPFAIPAAAKGARVVSLDLNLDACRLCRENAKINRVLANIEIIRADFRKSSQFLLSSFDRIISPTPYGAPGVPGHLAPLLKSGGLLHYYTFCPCREVEVMARSFLSQGWRVEAIRDCGGVASGINRFAFDLKKRTERFPGRDTPD